MMHWFSADKGGLSKGKGSIGINAWRIILVHDARAGEPHAWEKPALGTNGKLFLPKFTAFFWWQWQGEKGLGRHGGSIADTAPSAAQARN